MRSEEPLLVPSVSQRDWITFLVMGIVFALVAILPAFWSPWLLLIGVIYFPMSFAALQAARKAFRRRGRGIVIDEAGIGPAEEGVRLWTLPWDRYGGYRRVVLSYRDGLRHLERTGFEILDREGQRAFESPLELWRGPSSAAHTALVRELDRRVPSDGFPYDPLGDVDPRWSFVAGAAIFGTIFSLIACWGLHQPLTTKAWSIGVLAVLLAAGGFSSAGLELLSLRRKARGRLSPRRALPPLPEEGPGLERHVAHRENGPLRLEEGRRYRTVEPERQKAELRTNLAVAWIAPLGYGIALAYVALGFSDPRMTPLAVLGAAMFGGLTTAALPSFFGSRLLLRSVDDVLWVHDGHLVVVRPDGETLTLPLPDDDDRMARWRKTFTRGTDAWRLPDGTRYAIDRTRLYAAPNDFDEKIV